MLNARLYQRGAALGLATLCGLIGLSAQSVLATSLSPQDLQIVGSTFAFMQPSPSSEGVVAIVYAGRDSPSYLDAVAIMAAIGPSMTANGATLTPRLVEVSEVQSVEFRLVIVAVGANGPSVLQAARLRHALCVTGERAAVQAGYCTMAIRSSSRVEILLNHGAAQSSGIGFATAFRMMVHEL